MIEKNHDERKNEQSLPSQRLRDARKKLGLTLEQLGGFIGVSNQTVSSWENRKAPIPLMAAMALEKAFHISCDWLVDGTGDMFVGFNNSYEHFLASEAKASEFLAYPPCPEGYAFLPHISDRPDPTSKKEGIAGTRALMMFSIRWLEAQFGVSHQRLWLFDVMDDSMEPTLTTKDTVMLDCSGDLSQGIWLYGDSSRENLILKRLCRLPSGQIQAVSDNQLYPSFVIEPEQIRLALYPRVKPIDPPMGPNDVSLIGRVVWILKPV